MDYSLKPLAGDKRQALGWKLLPEIDGGMNVVSCLDLAADAGGQWWRMA